MPTSQADMEKLLKDEKDGGRWDSGLKMLNLFGGRLRAYTAGEMQQLCSLIPKACPDVKVLNMSNNELDDAQAAAVPEALERLPHLEYLWLYGNNKFGGEAAVKIFIAAVRHCLHLDDLIMPAHCDPNTVDWAQLGVTMSPDVLAAAEKPGNWQWGPMVKKQREMQAAGLVAPLPTVAAGVDQAKQAEAEATSKAEAQAKPKAEAEAKKAAEEEAKKEAEEASLSELLLGVGVKPNKVDQLLGLLKEHGIDDVDDFMEMDLEDVDKLNLPFLFAKHVTKLLSNLKVAPESPSGAASSQQEQETKFAAPKLIMGASTAAARGIQLYLGITDLSFLQRALEAIEEEWNASGTAEDKENVRYVIHGTARDPADIPPHMQAKIAAGKYHGGELKREDFDRGHDGMTLQDFVEHPSSKEAALTPGETAAIRLYTTSSYPQFNNPLRKGENPHPVKKTVFLLFEGLKKLRAVGAAMDPDGFNMVKWLWRGIKDKSLDYDTFKRRGGTELAPMSTTEDKNVALAYAAGQCPLIFRYKTRGLSRGCSISFLSMFPGEKEFLYPPLTFLSSDTNAPEEKEGNVTIYTVEPQMP